MNQVRELADEVHVAVPAEAEHEEASPDPLVGVQWHPVALLLTDAVQVVWFVAIEHVFLSGVTVAWPPLVANDVPVIDPLMLKLLFEMTLWPLIPLREVLVPLSDRI